VDWLTDPFSLAFLQRALVAGSLAAATCALVGIWVVLRGLAFMGDALAHGVLPGIAVAHVAGANTTLGAAVSALVMVGGVNYVQRRSRLPEDTGIGLLFVGMLGLGVIIISRAGSYFGDLVSFLFGAVLGVTAGDIAIQAGALAVALTATVILYRPLLVLAFDERKAEVLGLRPRLTRIVLLVLVALAVVSSFRAVGSLLVFALLVAPPATASLLVRRVPAMMLVGVAAGVLAVLVGLLVSYHYDLAAGAAIATTAVAQFFVVLLARDATAAVRARTAAAAP
jgi:ABC-type Mn2+/Zn2+ transport system permease subunit